MSLQSELVDAQNEAVTGQHARLGLYLGSRAGFDLSLKNQVAELDGFKTSNAIVSARLDSIQSALDVIHSSAQAALSSITSLIGAGGGQSSFESLGTDALAALTAAANSSAAGQYVFAGENAQTPPLQDYSAAPVSSAKAAIDAAFRSAFGFALGDPQAANISESEMQSFLDGSFHAEFAGAGWNGNWSNAGAVNPTVRVSPDAAVDSATSTNADAFKSLAAGYVALAEFGKAPFSSAVRETAVRAAAGMIARGMTYVVHEQAAVGIAQKRVEQADQHIAQQSAMLSTQIGSLDDVDMNEVSVKINMLTTQIQTSYSLTARLRALNLTQYISGA